ncbi:unnamed protein product [Leptidea sinapis]|uniref:Uncharacterized protein n=1 Tax=Leptidea sinapis TaxID=189913 RepID=A0A5E4QJX0_9NEOP|nr:unnamed protein product [Leptidea sinapis]
MTRLLSGGDVPMIMDSIYYLGRLSPDASISGSCEALRVSPGGCAAHGLRSIAGRIDVEAAPPPSSAARRHPPPSQRAPAARPASNLALTTRGRLLPPAACHLPVRRDPATYLMLPHARWVSRLPLHRPVIINSYLQEFVGKYFSFDDEEE